MNAALRALARAAGVRRMLLLSGLLSALGIICTALAFVQVARIIAAALLEGQTPSLHTLALIAALLLGRMLALTLREWLNGKLAAQEIERLRQRLTEAALGLGPTALAGKRGADLALLDAELDARFTPSFGRYLPSAVHAGVSVPILLTFTFWLDPSTAALLALTGPLTILFLYLVGLATHAATQAQWQAHTRLGARSLTLLRHLPTLHLYGQVRPYREVLARSAAQHRLLTLKVLRVAFLSGFVLEFAGTLATALVAVWIGVRLFGGAAELAPTLAALMLVAEYFAPLRQVGADRHAAMDAEPLAEQLEELFNTPLAPSGTAVAPALDLTFSHARAALSTPTGTLSAHLPAGTHAALRGLSGSGKSSLLAALAKYAPLEGEILVGGVPLDALDRDAWQARLAYVPQHPRLIAGSVWNNLRLLRPEAGEGEMVSAARRVGLHDLVSGLPQGFETPLGEGGVQISGGETARLALARALLSGANLVLLDEITAHLDAETEREILGVIRAAFTGPTVILATHRPIAGDWVELCLSPALRKDAA